MPDFLVRSDDRKQVNSFPMARRSSSKLVGCWQLISILPPASCICRFWMILRTGGRSLECSASVSRRSLLLNIGEPCILINLRSATCPRTVEGGEWSGDVHVGGVCMISRLYSQLVHAEDPRDSDDKNIMKNGSSRPLSISSIRITADTLVSDTRCL